MAGSQSLLTPPPVNGYLARRRYRALFRYGCHRGHQIIHSAALPCDICKRFDPVRPVRSWDDLSWVDAFRVLYPAADEFTGETIALSLAWGAVRADLGDNWPHAGLERSYHEIRSVSTDLPADVDVCNVALRRIDTLPVAIAERVRGVIREWNVRDLRRRWVVNYEIVDEVTDALDALEGAP